MLDGLGRRLQMAFGTLHPSMRDGSRQLVEVVFSDRRGDGGGARVILALEVALVRPFARSNAGLALAHPPCGFRQRLEVLGGEGAHRVGGSERVERFVPVASLDRVERGLEWVAVAIRTPRCGVA